MREKYYCANYACKSRFFCQRFIDDERPLDKVKSDNTFKSLLVPFFKGKDYTFFHPTKDGRCDYYVQSDKIDDIIKNEK